ncbi:hypothetical protein F5Y13DRAFT_167904 [Hypoxylon sp. FL1857]|nr:hypothetical protein F5Y13DRAFT_167904 [Hypoxylon sp. FL1857]
MHSFATIYNIFAYWARWLWVKLMKNLNADVQEKDQEYEKLLAELRARSAAAEATEDDEWGPEYDEDWNPADEARQARK